jgi:ABC-type transporter Mla MlaB component
VTVRIHDRANEFRIELIGKFSGESVGDVASSWKAALAEAFQRKCTVDISRLTGYDLAGRKLLREMYQHGTQFAAGNPVALALLNEISTPERTRPALVHTFSNEPRAGEKDSGKLWRVRAAGAK